jgi:subtilisin family serine protease
MCQLSDRLLVSKKGQKGRLKTLFTDVLLVTLGPLHGEAFGGVLDTAVNKGTVLGLPAGNEGDREPLPSLGGMLDAQAIVVGASNRKGEAASFSQRGKQVLWAPGEEIGLEVNGRRSEFQSGTSFSAAFAAGLVARLLAAHPAADRRGLRELLAATAKPVAANGVPVLNYTEAAARLGDR